MVIKRYYIVILISIIISPNAYGAGSCVDKTCVDVFTSVITAQKGKNKAALNQLLKSQLLKSYPSQASPFVIPKVLKKPVVKSTVVINKPVIKKPVAKKVVAKVASASLSDKLIKMLPAGDINFAPQQAALVKYIFGRKHQLDLLRSYQF